jgi:prophage regulatory protein
MNVTAMTDLSQPPEQLMMLVEASRRVGPGTSMIYVMIRYGRFPAPGKLWPFASRWSEQEVVAWIAEVKDRFEGKRRKV